MVTRLLHLCGLHLGAEEDLVPATADNQDGHWEHLQFQEINERLLNEFGGGWDRPPHVAPGWERDQRVAVLSDRAASLLRQFEGREPWGWKDPRTSLTLPFWSQLVPGLRAVVCVRNPLEVAISLRRRGLCSYAMGLNLWETYNRRLLESIEHATPIFTHYDAYFHDPVAEIRRVTSHLAMAVTEDAVEQCRAATKGDLRHNRFSTRQLSEAGVSSGVCDLYRHLCQAAEWKDPDDCARSPVLPAGGAASNPQRPLDLDAIENELLRREVDRLRRAMADRDEVISSLRAKPQPAAAPPTPDPAPRVERAPAPPPDWAEAIAGLRTAVAEIREQLCRQSEDFQSAVYDLQAAHAAAGEDPAVRAQRTGYRQLVRRVRDAVRAHVPSDGTVIVVSRGDDDLLKLYGRRGWHFPQHETGVYAGHYPANATAAVAHLEALRARGGQFLFLPATAAWWLDTYPDLRRHLEGRYPVVYEKDGTGVLYALASAAQATAADADAGEETLDQVIARFRGTLGRDPAVLDWGTGRKLGEALRELAVFVPPASDRASRGDTTGPDAQALPYIDRSIDVVALATDGPAALAEARRVASGAVIVFNGQEGARAPVRVEWTGETTAQPTPTVSIIIPVHNAFHHTRACLSALRDTLPPDFRGEIIVVDDASCDETPAKLREWEERDPRVRTVRNDANRGFVVSCNRGAADASGEVLVFLNSDTIPLPGWLPPLLRTLAERPAVGAVGGKLLFPDGRLQEAGGIIFRDASAAHFGRGDPDCDKPAYGYVREVDYCSAALMATPRATFESLGGFDREFEPGYYEDTDYCFRLRAAGRRVYFQPESVVVHLEGGTAGTDTTRGMKRYQVVNRDKFVGRWAAALQHQPERPTQFDDATWAALAHRPSEEHESP